MSSSSSSVSSSTSVRERRRENAARVFPSRSRSRGASATSTATSSTATSGSGSTSTSASVRRLRARATVSGSTATGATPGRRGRRLLDRRALPALIPPREPDADGDERDRQEDDEDEDDGHEEPACGSEPATLRDPVGRLRLRRRSVRPSVTGAGMPAASSAALTRARSSRSTPSCSCGRVRAVIRTITHAGRERLHAEHQRLGEDDATRTRGRARARVRSLRGSRRSRPSRRRRTRSRRRRARATTAATCSRRATITPLGTCHTTPSASRSRVVRSATPSTVPVATPVSMTSPTPNWSSSSMNRPLTKSLHERLRAEAQRDAGDARAREQRREVHAELLEDGEHRDRPDQDRRPGCATPRRSCCARCTRRTSDIGCVSTNEMPEPIAAMRSTPPIVCLHEPVHQRLRDPHRDPRDQEDHDDADRLRRARRRRRPPWRSR